MFILKPGFLFQGKPRLLCEPGVCALQCINVGRIAVNWGDTTTPPYGISIRTLVQNVGLSISGKGLLKDPYYNTRSIRAGHSLLDMPSVADMKLDWQVILEVPGEWTNSNVEGKYFELPE